MTVGILKNLKKLARIRPKKHRKAEKRTSQRASERSRENLRLHAAKLLALVQLANSNQIGSAEIDQALDQLREMIEQGNVEGVHVRLADALSEPGHLETAKSGIGFFPQANQTAIVRLQRFADDVMVGLDQLGGHESPAKGWELWPPHGMKRMARPGIPELNGDQFFEPALWKAQELLAAEFCNIEICDYRKCRKRFIPVHGRKYCSARCGQNKRAVTFKKSLSTDERQALNRIIFAQANAG